jgi:hypothetical protein
MRRLISQSRFAQRTGYSDSRISQLVKNGVIVLVEGKVDPDQAAAAIREKVFRPQRLDRLSPLNKSVCNECGDEPLHGADEPETFFCKRLGLTITKGG